MGDASTIELLVIFLSDKVAIRREVAAKVLTSLGWQPMNDAQGALRAVALCKWEEAKSFGSAALDPLLIAFGGEDLFVRLAAAEALGEIGDVRAVKPLEDALKNEGAHVRLAAAKALALLGLATDGRY